MAYYPAKWLLWAHLKAYTWQYTTSFIPCLITVGEEASNSWCHILQGKRYTHFTLSCPPSSFLIASPSPYLYLSLSLSFAFASSITFEESQIFHSHARGRILSTWMDSINLRWFAFLKLGKRNALCNTGNAFCINPVVEYIFESHGFLFLGLCVQTEITDCSCIDLNWKLTAVNNF